MDSGQDLILALREQRSLLIQSVHDMKTFGRYLAKSTRDYKIALRKEILRLKMEDGVAWTACYELALGEPTVADLRYKRDIYQSEYEVAIEQINAVKIELRLLENEIKQEWGSRE